MFQNLKSLLNRSLSQRSQAIGVGILSLVMVVTSGFWWFPVLA